MKVLSVEKTVRTHWQKNFSTGDGFCVGWIAF